MIGGRERRQTVVVAKNSALVPFEATELAALGFRRQTEQLPSSLFFL